MLSFLQKFQKIILASIFFLLPSQLGYHFWPDWAFVFGIRIDYFSPTIYIVDVLIILYLFTKLSKVNSLVQKNRSLFIFTLFIVFLNLFSSILFINSLFKFVRLFLYILFFLTLPQNKSDVEYIFKYLGFGVVVSGTLAALQFFSQSSIGGAFYYLGERALNISSIGASLVNLAGKNYLRPYSTFSHPNSMGGFGLISFAVFYLFYKGPKNFKNLFLVFSQVLIILSFSKTVWVSFLLLIFLKTMKNNKILFYNLILIFFSIGLFFSFLLPLASSNLIGRNPSYPLSVTERLQLASYVKNDNTNKLLGVGLNNFIKGREVYRANTKVLLQPVHNVFLLLIYETGYLGTTYFLLLILNYLIKTRAILNLSFLAIFFSVFFTSLFDHYWLTINQNILILLFFIVYFSRVYKKNYVKL